MSEWISVKECMPKDTREEVLVAYDTGKVGIDFLSVASKEPRFTFTHRGTATHWMPLPEAPREEHR